jgi:hypothetical protein
MEARRFESRIKDGRVLISVHMGSSNRSEKARKIFDEANAEDIFTMAKNPRPKRALQDAGTLAPPVVA